MHDIVDLRSDTLTLPTPGDARGHGARRGRRRRLGGGSDRPAPGGAGGPADWARRPALFVSSGTHGQPRLGARADAAGPGDRPRRSTRTSSTTRCAGAAVVGGVQTRARQDGARLPRRPTQVREAHPARPTSTSRSTGLVCVENTHNRHGGTCCTPEEIAAVAAAAHAARRARAPRRRAPLQRRGRARAARSPTSPAPVDSVTFCLSKGLGAPVGSLVCGSRDFVARARRVRKMLGGGMRQAGVLAAAGHRRARAHGGPARRGPRQRARASPRASTKLPGLGVDLASVQTNIVIFRVDAATGAAPTRAGHRLPGPQGQDPRDRARRRSGA